jgi:predicted RNase H-like HicB family nuclease
MSSSTTSTSTRFPVGLEEGSDGFANVHAFTVPGCVGTGATRADALDAFQATLGRWLAFTSSIGGRVPPPDTELEVTVDEWIVIDPALSGGESYACFEADREALNDADLQQGLRTLGALRGLLLRRIDRARNEDLEIALATGANARSILDELARAQWWVLTRLGASPLAMVPDHIVGRLDTAMALIVHTLTNLPLEARGGMLALDGEIWTARKVLRRLLWLEWTLGGVAIRRLDQSARSET